MKIGKFKNHLFFVLVTETKLQLSTNLNGVEDTALDAISTGDSPEFWSTLQMDLTLKKAEFSV